MSPVHLHVSVGPHYQQPCPREVAGDVGEQIQGAPVGIVQVLQHQHQRSGLGSVAKKVAYGLHKPVTVFFRVSRRPKLDLQFISDLGHYPRHVGRPGAQLLAQLLRL